MERTDDEVRPLARRVDFSECGPCGGTCCRTPWTVFVTPRDVDRLERATGLPRNAFAVVSCLPAWEQEAFGEDNLLFSRVAPSGEPVPQLRKGPQGACVFLDPDGRCGVHEAKPLLCRLFPYYYERAPFSSRERAAPLGTRSPGLRLLIDRGHEGFCPIRPERLAEVEAAAGDAALALCAAFEAEVQRYPGEKGAFLETFRAEPPTS